MPEPVPELALSPRHVQTLDLLLKGSSEKEAALALNISPHTIHTYVKSIYRSLGVCSRAELMAIWVRPSEPGAPETPEDLARQLTGSGA